MNSRKNKILQGFRHNLTLSPGVLAKVDIDVWITKVNSSMYYYRVCDDKEHRFAMRVLLRLRTHVPNF